MAGRSRRNANHTSPVVAKESKSQGSSQGVRQMQDNEYIVEKIVKKEHIRGQVKYLVKWKGYPTSANTWEPVANLEEGCKELLELFDRKQSPKTTPLKPKPNKKQTKRKGRAKVQPEPHQEQDEAKADEGQQADGDEEDHVQADDQPMDEEQADDEAQNGKASDEEQNGEASDEEQNHDASDEGQNGKAKVTDQGPNGDSTVAVKAPSEDSDDSDFDSSEFEVLTKCPAGRKAEEVRGLASINGEMAFLVKWKTRSTTVPEDDMHLVYADAMKTAFPEAVIAFYESHIIWGPKHAALVSRRKAVELIKENRTFAATERAAKANKRPAPATLALSTTTPRPKRKH